MTINMSEKEKFCKKLNELIKDEWQAPKDYTELYSDAEKLQVKEASSEELLTPLWQLTKLVIERSKSDENKHYQALKLLSVIHKCPIE